MTAPDCETPSTSWAVWAWQAYRDGRLVEARPTPLVEALAVPEVAALVNAAREQLSYMDLCKDYGDLERNLRAALRAIGEGRNG